MSEEKKLTPAMVQYYELKEKYSDCILFFRIGDFYEMFSRDAEIASAVLGIALTSRNKNSENPETLAGIPFHAKEKYLPKLVEAGYKVAIAEQFAENGQKGIFRREVVRVVTPATLDLETNDENKSFANYIISICYEKEKFGLSILEINSNKWISGELFTISDLSREIYKISPKEVILSKEIFSNSEIKDIFEKKLGLNIYFFENIKKPKEILLKHFGIQNLESFGLEGKDLAIQASSNLLNYLQENQKDNLSFIKNIQFSNFKEFLFLDESTIKSLDLVYNFATKSSHIGTLFGVLDNTKTSSGKRFLREAILNPLTEKEKILERQKFIEEFVNNKILLDEVSKNLKSINDLDIILNKISLGRIIPKDFVNLKNSLKSVLEIIEIIEKYGSENMKKLFKDFL